MRGLAAHFIAGACLLILTTDRGWHAEAGQSLGRLEFRITDHRPGIADFKRLEVSIDSLAIHRRGKARRDGWLEVMRGIPAVDIVPLKDGRWEPLGEASVPAGDYDALRVRFASASGELLKSGRPDVRADDTVVRLALSVRPEVTRPIVLDLFAEDLTDHEPQHYVVRVKEVRLGPCRSATGSIPEGSG